MSATFALPATVAVAPDPAAQELRRLLRTGLFVVALAAAAFGTWLALAPLSGAVIAAGVIKVETERKPVQHQEGGTVREILVRDGERVAAGQPLIVLGDVQVDASLEQLRLQADAELARQARLAAEQRLLTRLELTPELSGRQVEPRMAELIEREAGFFKLRRAALDGQLAALQTQGQATQQEIAARHGQAAADGEALRLLRAELVANEPLVPEGFISKTRLLNLQRGVVESQARGGSNQAELAQAHQRLAELQGRALNLRSDYAQQAERELKDSSARWMDLQQRLRPSQDAALRQRIVAPVAGVVVDLKVSSVGAVIGPRERLMDIVPQDAHLIVEARVRPEDVNHVQPGHAAQVRLTAFQQRITPSVAGSVVYVSADRLADPATPAGYYTAQVRLDADALARAGGLKLLPGMPAEVQVQTAERTPLAYLSEPLLAYLRRGLREP
jgi:membrane fusion protein, epimerase transport system